MLLKKKVYFFLTFFCIFFPAWTVNAASVGVSPAKYELDFEPNLEQNFVFRFSSDVDTVVFDVLIRGDLAKYATVDKKDFVGSDGLVSVSLKLPERLDEPGEHRLLIGALPSTNSGSGNSVGIVGIINGLVRVRVPYPGKYADVNFEIDDANIGEKAPYNLKIFSRGQESVFVSPHIEIYDVSEKKVKEFFLEGAEVASSSVAEIKKGLDLSGLVAGSYKAVAIVSYSGGEKKAVDYFRLGDLFVNITNYTRRFEMGKINPIDIDVVSGWNDLIGGVYASGNVIGSDISFLTPEIELRPWSEGKLTGFFDTSEIKAERFKINLTLYYGERSSEQILDLRLRGGEINYLFWTGIIIGGILILAFVIWVLVKLKSLEKRSGKEKKKK